MNMNKLNEHTDKAIDKLRFFTIKKDMKMVNFCAGSVVTIHVASNSLWVQELIPRPLKYKLSEMRFLLTREPSPPPTDF